jgi:hypothetical protein
MPKKPPLYKIEIEDTGDPWINHLGIILATIRCMSIEEREATLAFILSKYQPRLG